MVAADYLISGAVIAGGSSRRMGRDKRLLVFAGKTLLARAVDLLASECGEVLYVAPEPPPIPVQARHVRDRFPGLGVLSGIHAALSEARCELAVCIPVDTPLLTPQWIQLLARHAFARGAPACPRAGGRIHPIPGCWPRSVLPLVEAVLRSGNPAAHVALERSGASYVDEEAARAEGCDPAALANVNTQEEWEALLAASRLPG